MADTTLESGSRRLRMQYAGGIVKHLGLSMYRGAVPALAELIANAWDADADKVRVEIPFGTGLKDRQIVVRDDGHGMSWEDVQDAYLLVGRDRRMAGGEKTARGRTVMGRKGLGKLAGFGIARVVEVRTIHDGWLTLGRVTDGETHSTRAERGNASHQAVVDDRERDGRT